MTNRRYWLDQPDEFPYEDLEPDAESPEEDTPLPGLPAGLLAYQLNYRAS